MNDVLGGFELLKDDFYGNKQKGLGDSTSLPVNDPRYSVPQLDNDDESNLDISELGEDEDIDVTKLRDLKDKNSTKDSDNIESDEEVVEPSDDDIEDDGTKNNNLNNDLNDDSDESSSDDLDWANQESEIASFVSEQLSEKLGWELDEEDKFESVEDIVNYLAKVAEENSIPQYANEELQELDDYVRSGGTIQDYYSKAYQSRLNIDNIDVESTENQKAIVKQYLKDLGRKDSQINKIIERYEDTGILEDEAIDALDLLKENEDLNKKTLLENQKKQVKAQQEQQQRFIEDVELNIKDFNNVLGISVNDREKRELARYVLETDKNGMTQYQKDSTKDIKDWLESAYIVKNRKSLLNNINKKAKSESTKELKKRLEQSRSRKSKNKGVEGSSSTSFTDFVSSSSIRHLRKPGQ